MSHLCSSQMLVARADYFGAMYAYTGQPWFKASEDVSRGNLTRGSLTKYIDPTQIFGKPTFDDWISDVGNQIMITAKPEFREIYNNPNKYSFDWSKQRLYNEQNDPNIQKLHEKHYNQWIFFKGYANSEAGGSLLNPKDRINTGCDMMPEVKNCHQK